MTKLTELRSIGSEDFRSAVIHITSSLEEDMSHQCLKMGVVTEDVICAICLGSVGSYHRKNHTTDCGHIFHESCFEKVKYTCHADGGQSLLCPCCRSETAPVLKQQIREMDVSIKQASEYVRMYPMMQQSYIEHQQVKIKYLEEMLREAKHNKRLVFMELAASKRHNKEILENYKYSKRILQEKLRVDLAEFKKKRQR